MFFSTIVPVVVGWYSAGCPLISPTYIEFFGFDLPLFRSCVLFLFAVVFLLFALFCFLVSWMAWHGMDIDMDMDMGVFLCLFHYGITLVPFPL